MKELLWKFCKSLEYLCSTYLEVVSEACSEEEMKTNADGLNRDTCLIHQLDAVCIRLFVTVDHGKKIWGVQRENRHPGIDLGRILGIWTSAFFCLWNDTSVLATTLCSEEEYKHFMHVTCLKALLPWEQCGHFYHLSRWQGTTCLFAVCFNSLWLSNFSAIYVIFQQRKMFWFNTSVKKLPRHLVRNKE